MANITHWRLDRDSIRPKPIVQGHIEIDGQFTWEEWMLVEATFVKMRSGGLPSKRIMPTRTEIIEAIQEDAKNLNTDAIRALRIKYNWPEDRPLTLADFQEMEPEPPKRKELMDDY